MIKWQHTDIVQKNEAFLLVYATKANKNLCYRYEILLLLMQWRYLCTYMFNTNALKCPNSLSFNKVLLGLKMTTSLQG